MIVKSSSINKETHIRNASQREWTYSSKSRGLGDTIAKIAHAIGADKVASAYEKATGKQCGCKKRQDRMNNAIPYKRKSGGRL